ncbi:MAG: nickel pincer cofactor biosynthesis protein LarC [Nitrospirae bacterium]|nr:MAG: nickel pincer cofactor biosynthesis protein LarC [Nitrospirota bacterium]
MIGQHVDHTREVGNQRKGDGVTHLHLDCFSGISGDMFLGALIDCGLSLTELKQGLRQLPVKGYTVKAQKVMRSNIQATKVDIRVREGFTKPLSFAAIRRLLSQSRLSSYVKHHSLAVFSRLAEAEGHIHGVSPNKVHFHEIGVIDSLVDIVGAFLGCQSLDVKTVSCTPINLGSGTVQTAHGTLPVPSPAVAQLAKEVPVFSSGPRLELTTPTGIGIATQLTREFCAFPPLTPTAVGYGAGTADPEGWPNVLRVFRSYRGASRYGTLEPIVQLETNVDDLNPQAYPFLIEQLFARGALDVCLTPVIMKWGRPGTVVTVLASQPSVHSLLDVLFRESTTLGVRVQEVWRYVLPRRIDTVRVRNGSVRIKTAMINGFRKAMPEYEDCRAIAERTGQPLHMIMEEALHNFAKHHQRSRFEQPTARRSSAKSKL